MKNFKTHSFKIALPLVFLGLSSCAQLVTKTYSPTRSGVVKYSTGWFMGDKNREKAVEEMKTFCRPGRAKIVQEDSKFESTGQVYTTGQNKKDRFSSTSTEGREENMYIHFKCVK